MSVKPNPTVRVHQKSEGTVHNFSDYWAPHFTERRHSPETHDIPLLDVLLQNCITMITIM